MAGKRSIRKVIHSSSSKSIKIVTRNTNDFEDELDHLDYEPDFENSRFSLNSTNEDQSVIVTQNGENDIRNDEFNITNTHYNSIAEDDLSVSHRSDMLPYTRNLDDDDYITYDPSNSSRVLLDSSSSNGSSPKDDNNIEDDVNSYGSDYNISEELEDKLLESDNEDEFSHLDNENSETVFEEEKQAQIQENHSVFKNTEVKRIGKNFIITLNTLKNRSIKRPERKWNVHFRSHLKENVNLFLNDIGYIAPYLSSPLRSNPSESGSDGSGSESASPITFNVTIGGIYKRRHEKVQPEIENGFKVPLPPIKRPPTRPKRLGGSSTGSNMSPASSMTDSSDTYTRKTFIMDNKTNEIHSQKEDDAISIVASSIDRFEMEETQSSLNNDEFDNDVFQSGSYVADWVSSHVAEKPTLTPTNSVSSVQTRDHSPSSNVIYGPQIAFADVNKFFIGLCYHYYFNENCTRSICRLSHVVNVPKYSRKCWDLPKTELETIYNFALRFHLLFSHIYPVLLNGFTHHRMQNKLIACIDDFFGLRKEIDLPTAIEKVVSGLLETGLTISEAVEKISFNVGFMRHPELADILLDLIVQDHNNLSENWEEIKRICRAKSYMPPNIVKKIISRILSTPTNINKDLCRDIYNIIIKNEMTDVSKIPPELVNPLKTLAQFGSNVSNNALSNVIDRNLQIERKVFGREDSQNEPQTNVVTSDSDERHFPYAPSTQRVIAPPLTSPLSSSRTSTGSFERLNAEQEKRPDLITPPRDNNYLITPPRDNNFYYVPQALSASPKISGESSSEPRFINVPQEQSSEPRFVINVPPPTLPSTFSRPPPALRGPIPPLMGVKSPLSEINLCPEVPIFGKFRYKKEFVFDECLHNLLPSSRDQVQLNGDDIIKLNDIIKTGNGAGFLQILDQYKGPSTLQNFVTMSLATLKNFGDRPYNSLTDLIENIDILKPDFKRDPFLKGVFEVIIFNLLFFLERKGQWNDGRKLIETFCDWDSLISSKTLTMRRLTPMGRYIFLMKFLTEAKAFYKVYDILHSKDLNLLESPDRWGLYHIPNVDLESRNVLLTKFFQQAYSYNIEVVCDIYRKIFQFGDIWEFDAFCYFNPMLENLIDNEKTSSLKHFFSDIEIFYKKMNNNILRAFIIYLDNHLSIENKFKLYELAVHKGIYENYTGTEPVILVRTNMPDVELRLILEYYLHKLDREMSNHDVRIEIKLPTEIIKSPNILRKCLRSIAEVNKSIRKILYQCFGIFLQLPDQNLNTNITVIDIPKEELNSECRNAR